MLLKKENKSLILGVLAFLRDKNRDNRLWYLIFQTVITFGIYLIIEVQPRYSYHIIIAVIILAAVGVNRLCVQIRKVFECLSLAKAK